MEKHNKHAYWLAGKAAGLSCLLLGVVVIFGWLTYSTVLVQVNPNWAPMQFNTALGFCFLGVAFLAFKVNYILQHIAGVGAAVLGFFTIQQYALHTDFGIDELFFSHYITTETTHPGRMAPNTALCFSLLGASVGFVDRPIIRKIMAFIAIIISCIAVVGYLVGTEQYYQWSGLTGMAAHTSVGFLIASIGVFSMNGFRPGVTTA